MRLFLEIYFGFGLVVLGGTIENGNWRDYILAIFLGCPILISSFFWDKILKPLSETFQVKFYWSYYFRNGFRNIPPEKLKLMNDLAEAHHNTKSLSDIIWRHGLRLINKANNYKPNTIQP